MWLGWQHLWRRGKGRAAAAAVADVAPALLPALYPRAPVPLSAARVPLPSPPRPHGGDGSGGQDGVRCGATERSGSGGGHARAGRARDGCIVEGGAGVPPPGELAESQRGMGWYVEEREGAGPKLAIQSASAPPLRPAPGQCEWPPRPACLPLPGPHGPPPPAAWPLEAPSFRGRRAFREDLIEKQKIVRSRWFKYRTATHSICASKWTSTTSYLVNGVAQAGASGDKSLRRRRQQRRYQGGQPRRQRWRAQCDCGPLPRLPSRQPWVLLACSSRPLMTRPCLSAPRRRWVQQGARQGRTTGGVANAPVAAVVCGSGGYRKGAP